MCACAYFLKSNLNCLYNCEEFVTQSETRCKTSLNDFHICIVFCFLLICGMRAIFRNYVTLNTPARVLQISVGYIHIYGDYMCHQLYRVSFVQSLYLACLTIAKRRRRGRSGNRRSSLTTLSNFKFKARLRFLRQQSDKFAKDIKNRKTKI